MRKSMRRSAATPWLRTAISLCIETAQLAASRTEENSARKPSPVCLTMVPPWPATRGSMTSRRCDHQASMVASSSLLMRRV